jgi:phenylalanyl-tRNA synthetase alpha subunit
MDEILASLEGIEEEVSRRAQECSTEEELEVLRQEMLGREGRLHRALREMASLPARERSQVGGRVNECRRVIMRLIELRQGEL